MERTDAPLLNPRHRVRTHLYAGKTIAYGSLLQATMPSSSVQVRIFPLGLVLLQCHANAGVSLNAFQFGCESVSDELLNTTDPSLLQADLEAFGLFSAPELAVETSQPATALTVEQLDQDPLQVMGINVSPIQMAMVAASITNNGARPAPALVNSYLTPEGSWQSLGPGKTVAVVYTPSLAAELQSELRSSNHTIWYQIGHALINQEEPLTWYIGGTTPEWSATPLAIAVAIEADTSDLALTIGSTLLNLSATN